MEAVGVDRGVGGTGWQSRSEGTFKTDAWQGLGLDSGLAAETRQKIWQKKPPDAGERRG